MKITPIPNKSLGQHWLYDKDSLNAMCDGGDLKPNDTVMEIGPGLGTLTELLVKKVSRVVSVEFDARLAKELPSRVDASNLEVFNEDILKFDLTNLPKDFKVIANIPYYLTSNLIKVLSESPNMPKTAVLLIQKEVAERVVAEPGSMSILSVTAQFYWETSLGRIVEAELFTPPPKVDSQILILKRRAKPLFPDIDSKDFFRVVKTGFAQKRKTLLNSLSSGLSLSREDVQKTCDSANIDPTRRPQTLSLEEWHNLYQVASLEL